MHIYIFTLMHGDDKYMCNLFSSNISHSSPNMPLNCDISQSPSKEGAWDGYFHQISSNNKDIWTAYTTIAITCIILVSS